MKAVTQRKVRLVYGIFLGAFTVAVGILFLTQAADIYFSGIPYSREVVSQRLSLISIPFFLWIAAIVAGAVLWAVFPVPAERPKVSPDARKTLNKMLGRTATDCDKEEYLSALQKVRKEQKTRRIVWLCVLVLLLACAVYCLVRLFRFSDYPHDPTQAVLWLVRDLLPFLAAAFLLCIAAVIYDGIGAKKSLPYAKAMLAAAGKTTEPIRQSGAAAVLHSEKFLLAVRIAVFLIAVSFIVWGILNGGMADVLGKAINICTECIGLG